PEAPDRGRGTDIGLLLVVILAFTALVFSFVAFASGDDDAETSAAGGGGGAGASTSALATLTEFAISPEALVVSGSGTLDVRNDGSQVHNLVVVDQDVRTADLNGGESESLDVSSLSEGEYEVICDIAGHADAGMRGTMTVGDVPEGEAASGGDHGGSHAE